MTQVDVREAQAALCELLERVMAGEEIVITVDGRPVARLLPMEPAPVRRRSGSAVGQVAMSPDFDAPLPEFELP